MPALFPQRQPASVAAAWFASPAGQALLASESTALQAALAERPAPPWLWLQPLASGAAGPARGVRLAVSGDGWEGDLRCSDPLPFCSESLGTVVLQHVGDLPLDVHGLLDECARVLVPGGCAWLFALNPLSPYRRHWYGSGLASSEPLTWRRRMR